MVEHLSYSSISKYLSCPAAWKYQYVDKVPTVPNVNLVFGSAWHGAVERLATDLQITIEQAWTESWIRQTEGKAIDWGFDTPEGVSNEGLRMLADGEIMSTIRGMRPKRQGEGYLVEKKVSLTVPGVEVPVIGYIDLIEESGVPADIKTSSRSWSSEQAINEMQPLFYLAAMNQEGLQTPGYRFKHYIFVKTKQPKVQIIESAHNFGKIVFLFQMIKHVWEAIRVGAYPENPTTWLCNAQYCDFWRNCRGKYE